MSDQPIPASFKIGFLGAGRMATALARGFVQSGQVDADQIFAADISTVSLEHFQQNVPGAGIATDNFELAQRASLLVLALKPQTAPAAIPLLRPLSAETTVLSVMAGIRLGSLESWLGTPRLVRCMPNTPSLLGLGAIGLSANPKVDSATLSMIEGLLRSVGVVVRTTESQLDAVTGLSGSGPAYVFSFLRALISGGVAAGLPPEAARTLALQTVSGAVEMLSRFESSAQELIEQVSSPGGTTVRGLEVLRAGGFEQLVSDCVVAASKRAKELGD